MCARNSTRFCRPVASGSHRAARNASHLTVMSIASFQKWTPWTSFYSDRRDVDQTWNGHGIGHRFWPPAYSLFWIGARRAVAINSSSRGADTATAPQNAHPRFPVSQAFPSLLPGSLSCPTISTRQWDIGVVSSRLVSPPFVASVLIHSNHVFTLARPLRRLVLYSGYGRRPS